MSRTERSVIHRAGGFIRTSRKVRHKGLRMDGVSTKWCSTQWSDLPIAALREIYQPK